MSVGASASEVWALARLVHLVVWALCIAASAVLAFSTARYLSGRVRVLFLVILVPLPVWLLTLPIIYLPPAPPSPFAWWVAGMTMIAPVAIAWAIVAVMGAKLGWRNVR